MRKLLLPPPSLFPSLRSGHSFGERSPLPALAAGPLFALMLCLPYFGGAQHYLPNGDFTNLNICCEYHVSCAPMGWWTSSSSTFNFKPVLYDKSKRPIPVPAMIKMLGEDGLNERSYIQAPLLCPLKEGETYEIEIRYAQRKIRFDYLGVYFSDSFVHIPAKKVYTIDTLTGAFRVHQYDSLVAFKPQQEFHLDTRPTAIGVQKLTLFYTATGKEKFILLGNFSGDPFTSFQKSPLAKKEPASYVSIHQITLRAANGEPCECERQEEILETLNRRHSFFGACEDSLALDMNQLFSEVEIWKPHVLPLPAKPAAPTLVPGKAYLIERLYFAFDSAVLESRSFPALDSLAGILRHYPDFQVSIVGHTDSLGNAEYNELLSLNRAEVVKQYLISRGIAPEKLTATGRGSSEPLATNHTEEGRQLNRRVEFMLRED
jgi:outer membrane protein OmpA-like peptidoglycan-associated protein